MEEFNENTEKPKMKLSLAVDSAQTNKETADTDMSQSEFVGNRYSGYYQQEAGAYQGSDTYYTSVSVDTHTNNDKISFIMGIVFWVALLIPIIVCAIGFFSSEMTYDRFDRMFKIASYIFRFVCLVDALVYNIVEERRIRLIVVAVLLTLIYPFFRCSAYQGSSGKYWIWLIVFLLSMSGAVLKTTQYQDANLPELSEQESRNIINHFEQLPLENSKTMDSVISDSLKNIYYQIYEYTDGTYQVQVFGMGNVKPEGDAFQISSDYNNKTMLVFELPSTLDSYKLTSISVNDKRLNNIYKKNMWDIFLNPNSL